MPSGCFIIGAATLAMAQTPQWLPGGGRLISDLGGYRVVDAKGISGPHLVLPLGGRSSSEERAKSSDMQEGLAAFLESRNVGVHDFQGAIVSTRVFRTEAAPSGGSKLLGFSVGGRGRLELMRLQGGAARVMAGIEIEQTTRTPILFPLDNEQILSVGPVPWEVPKGKRQTSPFALWGISDRSELVFRHFLEVPLPKGPHGARFQKGLPRLELRVTDEYVVACHKGWGWFWSLSRKDGRVKRFLELYPDLPAAAMQGGGDWSPLAGVATCADGTLLIAARPREAFLKGLEELEAAARAAASLEPMLPPGGGKLSAASVQQMERAHLFRDRQAEELQGKYPFLEWHEWDPGKPSAKRLHAAPPGARSTCLTRKEFEAEWQVDRFGVVAYRSSR